MASIWTQRARNLPAQQSETTALAALLKEDLEYKNLIENRQRALKRRILKQKVLLTLFLSASMRQMRSGAHLRQIPSPPKDLKSG